MSRQTRLVALLFAALGLAGAFAGSASAAPPVKIEGCELIVEVPTTGKSVAVPICQNGPPI